MADKKYEKVYYSIGEVSEMLNITPSHIRFLEQEFKILKPIKGNNGIRKFSKNEIKNIELIIYLTKEKGLTFEGAKKQIKENRNEMENSFEIIQKLTKIKNELIEVKEELSC
ncbi:MAG: MerR family transcriptional regulator [Bacteroidales bacterium]|jgi:DNA-binding transcriptional MerR regulator|nr:MerR family transcriptional regulator [Bacteroidales bacterium]